MEEYIDNEPHNLDKGNSLFDKINILKRYSIIKLENPNIKEEIKKLKLDILKDLSKYDKKTGSWLSKLIKRVMNTHGKYVNLKELETKYKTEDKDIIAKKLINYYSNYAIATGAVLGSTGGILGFVTAASSTFGEMVCLTYFQLCLIYDLSVVFERKLSEVSFEEVYIVISRGLNCSDGNMIKDSINEAIDEGSKIIDNRLNKNVSSEIPKFLQDMSKELGVKIMERSIRNLLSKVIPLFGAASGAVVCAASDYKSTRYVGKRIIGYYGSKELLNQLDISGM